MHDVFISYSTVDSRCALDTRSFLENSGIPCWIAPRDIPSGSNYTKEIPAAIRGCKVFLLLLSEHAQQSHWVLKELDAAVNERKFIIPVVLDDAPLSDEFAFLLSGAQRHPACPLEMETLLSLRSRILAVTRPGESVERETIRIPVLAVTGGEPLKGVFCPACKSSDVQEKPKKIRRHGKELFTLLLIAAGMIAASVIGVILVFAVLFIIPASDLGGGFYSTVLTVSFIVFMAAGGWLGDRLGKEMIRRKRVRKHLSVQEFRCNACSKQFHITE